MSGPSSICRDPAGCWLGITIFSIPVIVSIVLYVVGAVPLKNTLSGYRVLRAASIITGMWVSLYVAALLRCCCSSCR